jgi:hypothetical protein
VMLTHISLEPAQPARSLIQYRLPGMSGHRASLAKMRQRTLPDYGNQLARVPAAQAPGAVAAQERGLA